MDKRREGEEFLALKFLRARAGAFLFKLDPNEREIALDGSTAPLLKGEKEQENRMKRRIYKGESMECSNSLQLLRIRQKFSVKESLKR